MRFNSTQCAVLAALVALLSANISAVSILDGNHPEEGDHDDDDDEATTRAPIFREANHCEHDASAQQLTDYKLLAEKRDPALGSNVQARLMKELRDLYKSDSYKRGIIGVELRDGEKNLREWLVKLSLSEGRLYEDLVQLKDMGKANQILLQVSFGDNYPDEPPFVRVLYPVLFGAQVNRAGTLCFDILMGQGYASSFSIESFLLTILSALQEKHVNVYFEKTLNKKEHDYPREEDARACFEDMKSFHDEIGNWRGET